MIPVGGDALAAMRARVSVRSYSEQLPQPALVQQLVDSVTATDHLTTGPTRIELVTGVEATRGVLKHVIGSFGLVQNAPLLLVGVIPVDSDPARIDLGYVLEQLILEATRLGLGTCWITGSYDAHAAADAVGLAPGEVAAAVCALGYPATTRLGRFHSQTVRRLAGGAHRKPLAEMVFSETWGAPWAREEAEPALASALEYARLAPSAANRQPWRFIVRAERIVLATVRRNPIDAGIVMAHFALAWYALGRQGHWCLECDHHELAREYGLPSGTTLVGSFADVAGC